MEPEEIRQVTAAKKGMKGKVTWISFNAKYLKWVKAKDPKARLGLLGVAADDATLKGFIKEAKGLRSGSNQVFLDLAKAPDTVASPFNWKNAISLCDKADLPVEIWNMLPLLYDERDVMKNLDPYITGVTVDKYKYVAPKKAANALSIKGKTARLSYRKLQKKTRTLAVSKVIRFKKKGQGTLSYKLGSVKSSKFKKYFRVNAKTGKVTIKKGLRKGTYQVKISVKAAGDSKHKAATKTATAEIIVK